jgi:isopenicillin N synthase-like dioxygenase
VDQHLVAEQLRQACEQRGFFYITGHGIDPALISSLFAASQRFFDLPMTEKLAVDKKLSRCNRGYEPLRAQTLESGAPPDLKESFTPAPRSRPTMRACWPAASIPAPTNGPKPCPTSAP